MSAKDIVLKPIARAEADSVVKRLHYSGCAVRNSQLNIGVYYNGNLEGAIQFGPSLDKRKLVGLVAGTAWNGFIELNRLAFSELLPRNSESRALSIAMRLIRKYAPHLEWVVTFADGMQCGDGTIYRAAGFVLTGVSTGSMVELPDDFAQISGKKVAHRMTLQDKSSSVSLEMLRRTGGRNVSMVEFCRRFGGRVLPGYSFRYIYFLNPSARERLTVPTLSYDTIKRLDGQMYRGIRGGSLESEARATRARGRFNTTPPLHKGSDADGNEWKETME